MVVSAEQAGLLRRSILLWLDPVRQSLLLGAAIGACVLLTTGKSQGADSRLRDGPFCIGVDRCYLLTTTRWV
jgi:hypothetical protein